MTKANRRSRIRGKCYGLRGGNDCTQDNMCTSLSSCCGSSGKEVSRHMAGLAWKRMAGQEGNVVQGQGSFAEVASKKWIYTRVCRGKTTPGADMMT